MFFSFHHKWLYKIGKLLKLIILIPHPDSIGNAAEEIYYATLKAKKEKKKVAIIYPKKIVFFLDYINFYDKNFFSLKSKYFLFEHNSFLQNFFGYIFSLYFIFARIIHTILTKFFKVKKSGYYWRPMSGSDILWRPDIRSIKFDIYKSKKQDWGNQHKNYLDIEITQQSNERCNKIFQSLGYRNRDFICIHVREGGYKGDHLSNLLNVNIRNFIKAIKEICGRGFLVFRLGDSSMTKLPKIKNLIDYPFTNYKSAEMDNFLIKNCKFFICGPSGPLDSGRFIHKKRMLFHNSYNFFDLPFNPGDIALMRPFYSKSKQRYLSIEEICLYYKKINNSWWMSKDWIMGENDEDEILEAVKQMLNKNILSTSPVQKRLKDYQLKATRYLLKNFRFQENDLDNINDKYRFASRSFYWKGLFSESFLKKRWKKY